MFCAKCGSEVQSDWKVCPRCEAPIKFAAATKSLAPETPIMPREKSRWWHLGCLGLLAVSTVTFWVAVLVAVLIDNQQEAKRRADEAERMKDPAYAEAKRKEQKEWAEIRAAMRVLQTRRSEVTAAELMRAYGENEVAADERFKGKQLVVTGVVRDVGKDILGTPYITLATDGSAGSIQCMLSRSAGDKLTAVRKGSTIVLGGRCDGKLVNVILRECDWF